MPPLVVFPWIAFAIAAAFVVLWRWRAVRSAAAAALLWAAYGIYESLMHARVLCSGECNIRLDLLLVHPLLVATSAVALWQTWRRR